MPDVAHLLSTPMDDPSLDIPYCPVGTWSGELVKITYRDKDRDNEPLTDKNGDTYAMVRLICRPSTALDDVDKSEAKKFVTAGGPQETILSQTVFIRGKRSVSSLNRQLKSLGVPVAGRSIKAVAEEYKGGIPCNFEVTHRQDDQGETREDIAAVYPVD